MAVQVWETLKEYITVYTGLSPATFFSFLALLWAIYYVATELFGSSGDHHQRPRSFEEKQEEEPLPPPVQLGEVTEEELLLYDGSDPKKPLLMAIKGQIYDVSQSRMFYGPGGPYALFAGRDASRALAKMSFEKEDLTGDISGLGAFELDALRDWEYKFMSKYVKVGTVKSSVPVTDAPASSEATEPAAAKPAEDVAAATESREVAAAKPAEDNIASTTESREVAAAKPAEDNIASTTETTEVAAAKPAEDNIASTTETTEVAGAKPEEDAAAAAKEKETDARE